MRFWHSPTSEKRNDAAAVRPWRVAILLVVGLLLIGRALPSSAQVEDLGTPVALDAIPTQAPSPTAVPKENARVAAAGLVVAAAVSLPITATLSPVSPVTAGSTVTAQASWSSAPGGRPTGTVTYTVFNGAGCTGTIFAAAGAKTISSASGTFGTVAASDAVAFPAAGSYSWQALYGGDAAYSGSSACVNLLVNLASPVLTLSVAAAAPPMTVGGSAAGTATLSAAATTTAGGTVTYTLYSDSTCTTVLVTPGAPAIVTVTNRSVPASPQLTPDHAGTTYWKAVYSGDAGNNAASSSCVSFAVAKVIPTVGLTVTPAISPMVAGGTASGAVNLTGETSSAGGTVSYTVYTNNTCTTQISPAQTGSKSVTNGVVPTSDAYSYPNAGIFYWKAVYSGDTDNTTASSSCTAITVAKANPTVALSLSPSGSILAGTAVTGTAALTGYSPTAAGSMVYAVYTDSTCATQVSPALTSTKTVAAGVPPASTAQTHNVAGTIYWRAAYAGDANNNAANSACIPLSVTKATPSLSLTVAANSPPMVAAGSAKGTGVLTGRTSTAAGTAVYTIYSDSLCTTTLVTSGNPNSKTVASGAIPVSSSITMNLAGTFYWQVSYSGDANNQAALSPCVAFVVGKKSPTITLAITAQASPMKVGGTSTGKGTLSGSTTTAAGSAVYSVYSDSSCTTPLTALNSPSTVTVASKTVATSARITINLAGTVYWQVVYSGDANNNGATSACISQTVAKSTPTLALSITPTTSPMRVGGTATGNVTMTLAGTNSGGTLTYTLYSDNTCATTLTAANSPSTVTVVNRTVPSSALITITKVGTVYWKAAYGGDTNNNAATSSCVAQTINKTAPTLSLTIAPAVSPMTVANTAIGKVVLSGSTAAAGGSLTYTVYSNSTCSTSYTTSGNPSTVSVSNHLAPDSAAITFNAVGTYYWKASYAGDTDNAAAASSCVSLTVSKRQPTLSLTVNPATTPMVTGGTASGAASMSGSTTNAGGTVTYTVFTNNSCTTAVTPAMTSAKTVTNAVVPASSSLTFANAGTFFWAASYGGDASNLTATSPCISLSVSAPGATSVALSVSPNPVVVRQNAIASAVLSGTTNTAGGTITYTIYSDSACSTQVVPEQSSTATVTNAVAGASQAMTLTTVGTVYWQAVYSGDLANLGSSSACVSQSVIKGSPTLMLSLSPNPVVAGFTSVALGVLSDPAGTPSGTVTYSVFSNNTCATAVTPAVTDVGTLSSGVVPPSRALLFDTIGSFYVRAEYSGDSANTAAVSTCVEISVIRTSPVISLVLSPNPAQIGQSFNAAITFLDGDSPTGNVTLTTYTDSACSQVSADVATQTLAITNNIVATPAAAFLTTSDTLYRQASYAGDANNFPASSHCVPQVVVPGDLTAVIESASLSTVTYSNAGTQSTGTIVVQVSDDRDTGDGWSVTLTSSDFSYSGLSNNEPGLSASGFSIATESTPTVVYGQVIGSGGPYADGDAIGSLDEVRTLLVAESGFGAGQYRVTANVTLDIPAGSQAGNYTATLTIATSAAP